jgi:hypothetical protein
MGKLTFHLIDENSIGVMSLCIPQTTRCQVPASTVPASTMVRCAAKKQNPRLDKSTYAEVTRILSAGPMAWLTRDAERVEPLEALSHPYVSDK